jgi:cell division protease FtsH
MADFEHAKDKVMMGSERRSMVITEEEKRHTAYHEAGHALVAALVPQALPVHKVTIIPRGLALGVTMFLPETDRNDLSKEQAEAQIAVSMGGRAADELVCQMKTAGASSDLEKATELARRMVCEWGMSEKLGPLTFGKREEQIFLGREISKTQDYSDETAILIDQEVKHLVVSNYELATRLLTENKAILLKIADELLAREVLDADQVSRLVKGLPLQEIVPPPATPAPAAGEPRRETPERPAIVPALGKPVGQE